MALIFTGILLHKTDFVVIVYRTNWYTIKFIFNIIWTFKAFHIISIPVSPKPNSDEHTQVFMTKYFTIAILQLGFNKNKLLYNYQNLKNNRCHYTFCIWITDTYPVLYKQPNCRYFSEHPTNVYKSQDVNFQYFDLCVFPEFLKHYT